MRFLLAPFKDFLTLFEAHLQAGRGAALAAILLGLAAAWWIYVPLHELLHAWGCLAAGGQVERLEIDPLYGAHLLARIFPYVHPGSDYAGRLSDFNSAGSDWTYAATVAAPLLLGLAGFPLLRLAVPSSTSSRGLAWRRPLLFGAAALLAASPLLSLTGDLLELGSLTLYQFFPGPAQSHRALISDDLFRLLHEWPAPPGWRPVAFVTLSQTLGLAYAWSLVALSHRLAGGSRAFANDSPSC